MPQRALIKRILLSAVACLSIMLFHQFQGVIIEGVRGPLPRVILDPGCLPPPRRGDDRCRDDCRTVVAPAFAAKNFRHLAGTKAKARWNATAADAPKEPTATHGAAAAKWDPRRVGYYRARFQEETACLRAAARRSA